MKTLQTIYTTTIIKHYQLKEKKKETLNTVQEKVKFINSLKLVVPIRQYLYKYDTLKTF